jgi:iron complex transport system ATP-binding protein
MTPAVRIDNLAVHAGPTLLLDVEHWHVPAGELHVVLGANGAGKSTLLRVLAGRMGADRGNATLLGEPLGRTGPSRSLRRRIAYMPQLLPPGGEMPLTLREVVAIGRSGLAGLGRRLKREDWCRVDEWLGRLGLAELATRRYSDCSGGEQRKALLAKAMVQAPDLLLLDEPTANLDLRWRGTVVEAIEAVHEAGPITVVMVCHELDAIPACCSGAVLLSGGRAVAAGPVGEVLTAGHVEATFGRSAMAMERRSRQWLIERGGSDG